MYKELGAANFCVATRTRPFYQKYVATLSKSVTAEYKIKLIKPITTENCMLRQKPMTKTKNSVAIELST